MIWHILKQAWKRKGSNFILIVEIFVTFLVLTGVITAGIFFLSNYLQPHGFSYKHVWEIQARHTDIEISRNDIDPPDIRDTLKQLKGSLLSIPEIENACVSIALHPFISWGNQGPYTYEGKTVYCGYAYAGDDFTGVFKPDLAAGRWFDTSDEGSHRVPIVVTKRMGRELFGEEIPLDRIINKRYSTGERTDYIVIGVLNNFKKYGELNKPLSFMFQYQSFSKPIERSDFSLYIRVIPSATVKLEEEIMSVLRSVARDFTYNITPLEARREVQIKSKLSLYMIFFIIGVSLLVMIGLGIFGVLWQNISRRTCEIGLRRAHGATARAIYTQILGEILILATFALFFGVLLLIHFPLLNIIEHVSGKIWFLGITAGVAVMFCMIVCCSLYPGYMATRIQPAEALHYE